MSRKFKFISGKKKERASLFSFVDDYSDCEYIGGAHIEVIANKRMTVEGCYGVSQYAEDYIKLRLQKGYISIAGKEFNIISYENRSITIKGSISAIEFFM